MSDADAEVGATTARALAVLRARYPLSPDAWGPLGASFTALAGASAGTHAAFACFSLLLGHGHCEPEGLLGLVGEKQATGQLAALASARLWGELSVELRATPRAEHAGLVSRLVEREAQAVKARLAAQATLGPMLPVLAWSLPSLVPMRAHVALRAVPVRDREDPSHLRAYTDGRDIFLPARVAIFDRVARNELVYLRLLVHEALHLSEGSFATAAARSAFGWVAEQLRARGLLGHELDVAAPPTLKTLTALFGEHGELFFSLFNCVEDARVERRIPELLPAFAPVVELVDQAVRSLARPAVFEPLAVQVLRCLHAAVDGRAAHGLPSTFARPFAAIEPKIRAFRALAAPALRDSIMLGTELCLWCIEHLGAAARAQVLQALQDRRPVSAKSSENYVDLPSPGRRPPEQLRRGMNLDHVSRLEPADLVVPEYDFWQQRERELGASVSYEPWDPQRAAVVGRAVRCEVAIGEARGRREATFRSSGVRLDAKRFVRLLATRRAGGKLDARIFRGRDLQRTDLHATVVVDLSVSMVHYRPDGVRPLERAIGLIEDLATRLGDGAPLTILGCVDGGPERVRLFRIKERHEPLKRGVLDSLHGYSLGGFRVGAVLRALAQGAVDRTRVLLITDAGSHYVTRGVRRVWRFERELCKTCPVPGSLCDLERSFPDQLWIGDRASIFEPLEYEVADIRHALASTARVLDVHTTLLTHHWGDDLCDHTFGAGGWSKV